MGDVAWRREQLAEAASYIEKSLSLARLARDTTRVMYALNRLGSIYFFQNDLDRATQCHTENRTISLQSGNRERAIAAIGNLGEIARIRGDYPGAHSLYSEALVIAREIGHRVYQTLLCNYLGLNALATDNRAGAAVWLTAALRLAQEQHAPALMLAALAGLARLRVQEGRIDDGAAWLGLIAVHPAADVNIRADINPLIDSLRATHGDARINAAMEAGRGHTLDALVSEALG